MEKKIENTSGRALAEFVSQLRHRRDVLGFSQKVFAEEVKFDKSYISKVENGAMLPSRDFVLRADKILKANRTLVRLWDEYVRIKATDGDPEVAASANKPAPAPGLVVIQEVANLTLENGVFTTSVTRHIRNDGIEPLHRYLIRISVDHYPGDADRSNRFYRENPLTWEEISLRAFCEERPMDGEVKSDRDAFKEVWLLFRNGTERYPLYPGEDITFNYAYSVPEEKWGPWWQRAIRIPTCELILSLHLPKETDPKVWGLITSGGERASFPTPIRRQDGFSHTIFHWDTSDPELDARYRMEWKMTSVDGQKTKADILSPSERMKGVGILQEGESILEEPAVAFDLPRESDDARRVIAHLSGTVSRVKQLHNFAKGMGLAAPQVGIGRSAAIVETPEGETIILLNPEIIDPPSTADHRYAGGATDHKYEGCLSFFDVRGMVPRPARIEVRHQDIDGATKITIFDGAVARLVAHEVDHLDGIMYKSRMDAGDAVIPVSEYKGTGQSWS